VGGFLVGLVAMMAAPSQAIMVSVVTAVARDPGGTQPEWPTVRRSRSWSGRFGLMMLALTNVPSALFGEMMHLPCSITDIIRYLSAHA
jgi:hypothetical protein